MQPIGRAPTFQQSLSRTFGFPHHFGRAHARFHSSYFASTVIPAMSLAATVIIAAATGFDSAGSHEWDWYPIQNASILVVCLA
ncbi:hypothetical protein AGR8A_pTi20121 [Agrobacterium fabrum str. J-07]|nr:hypothetical protein AGR8A_pTi20121 [Agrobacterium fabrum str. J-07]